MYIFKSSLATCVAVLGCLLNALPVTGALVPRDDAGDVESSTTVYQFPNPTWLENLAVRSNGEILVTVINPADLYKVDVRRTPATATLLYSFTGLNTTTGITEVTPDVFAVVVGNYSLATGTVTPRSFSVWEVDLRSHEPAISKIADLPEAALLNGMTTLSSRKGTILISDSGLGVVWRLNTRTGEYAVVLDDKTTRPVPGAELQIGINGIRRLRDYLYFVNLGRALFCRVRIDLQTGTAIGPYEIIATGLVGDDFDITKDGTAYVTGVISNVVWRVTPDGTVTVVAGNLTGPTSAQFGRTKDKNTLYVVTSGAMITPDPINVTFAEGGKVVALETD
ncbi:hypothetical protein H2201_008868 [Coniosporium apollinis]|uniref:SMP-30/Gluconolactonase/LRE-like region domain-containing protein n=1 Tax=Coniosporium apollinis TaxID=61459 RepID=A0ABQ9NG15_9PEZI|nr:hypothetical protein H2201_008868 [Coniosporium apollinis]